MSRVLRREIMRFEVGSKRRSVVALVLYCKYDTGLFICCVTICFKRERIKEFKEKFISYLESLMQMQQEVCLD